VLEDEEAHAAVGTRHALGENGRPLLGIEVAAEGLFLSDVQKEALARHGLLVWGGLPDSPSVVRDKLLAHITANRGRVVLFGAAARSMFPQWFADPSPTSVARGSTIGYGDGTFPESSAFLLESLRDDLAGC